MAKKIRHGLTALSGAGVRDGPERRGTALSGTAGTHPACSLMAGTVSTVARAAQRERALKRRRGYAPHFPLGWHGQNRRQRGRPCSGRKTNNRNKRLDDRPERTARTARQGTAQDVLAQERHAADRASIRQGPALRGRELLHAPVRPRCVSGRVRYASGASSPAGMSALPPSIRFVKFSGLMGRA